MEINKKNFPALVKATAKEYGEDFEKLGKPEFTSKLKADKEGDCLTITLNHENRIGIGDEETNMQIDYNCFEGWAVIFYV